MTNKVAHISSLKNNNSSSSLCQISEDGRSQFVVVVAVVVVVVELRWKSLLHIFQSVACVLSPCCLIDSLMQRERAVAK